MSARKSKAKPATYQITGGNPRKSYSKTLRELKEGESVFLPTNLASALQLAYLAIGSRCYAARREGSGVRVWRKARDDAAVKLKIERGIPPPKREMTGREFVLQLKDMKPGESTVLPLRREFAQRLARDAFGPRAHASQPAGTGTRVWRLL